jgi:hypothetical protein
LSNSKLNRGSAERVALAGFEKAAAGRLPAERVAGVFNNAE